MAMVVAFIGTPFICYGLGLALGYLTWLLALIVSLGAGVGTFMFTLRRLQAYMSN
jgi:hypothetical protein